MFKKYDGAFTGSIYGTFTINKAACKLSIHFYAQFVAFIAPCARFADCN
jgi:hypothetical protein